jgi:hypothetical protein
MHYVENKLKIKNDNELIQEERSIKLPKRCEMPDLSKLNDEFTLALMLNRFFRGGGPKNHISYALVANFIRLADQTLQEYKAARTALLEYIHRPNNNVISPFFRATGHCEICLSLLDRSLNFVERIRRDRNTLQIPKNLSVLSGTVMTRIRKFRNVIEHLYDDILDRKIHKGDPIALLVNSDSIELLGEKIYFKEIALWIQELNSLASTLAIYAE